MTEVFEGIVLDKSFRGESGLLLSVLRADGGVRVLHKKVSRKKPSALPDYFDTASFEAEESKAGGILFLGGFEILARRAGIAADYDAFKNACEISKFALKNSKFLESFGALYDLVGASFCAIDSGADSFAVRAKFLYAFAKSEGYAAKEDFAAGLCAEDFECLKKILSAPAASLRSVPRAASLLERLVFWIGSSTDFSA